MSDQAKAVEYQYRWRFYFLIAMLFLLLAALFVRALWVQVVSKEFYIDQGMARIQDVDTIKVPRGEIVDRNGEPLAVSTPVITLHGEPRFMQQQDLPILAAKTGTKLSKLKQRFALGKQDIIIARNLNPAIADSILALKLKGIYAEHTYKRFYPAGEVSAQLIGFTDLNDFGQEGLELAFEHFLSGQHGQKRVLKDRKGQVIRDVEQIKQAKAGQDLKLTVDLQLQYIAYKELKKRVTELHADSGSVVILDVNSNDVLAMANMPSYNPNNRAQLKGEALRNRVLVDQIEPGSVMKTFTLAAGLESGKFTPESSFVIQPMRLQGRCTRLTTRYSGKEMDLPLILSKSDNVGATKVALEVGYQYLWDFLYNLGFGQDSGFGFPGEPPGDLPNHVNWDESRLSNLSFGYGIGVTSIQLAQALAVIANNGIKQPLKLFQDVSVTQPPQQILSQDTALEMQQMMQQVVKRNMTGFLANAQHYSVAGKTGTVQGVGNSGFDDQVHHTRFFGFAPANDPKIVIVVIINNPKGLAPSGNTWGGGSAAAPVFAKIVDQSLPLLNVLPDKVAKNEKP